MSEKREDNFETLYALTIHAPTLNVINHDIGAMHFTNFVEELVDIITMYSVFCLTFAITDNWDTAIRTKSF